MTGVNGHSADVETKSDARLRKDTEISRVLAVHHSSVRAEQDGRIAPKGDRSFWSRREKPGRTRVRGESFSGDSLDGRRGLLCGQAPFLWVLSCRRAARGIRAVEATGGNPLGCSGGVALDAECCRSQHRYPGE